ncbi:hypothetical protein NYF13_30895 [Amycolatopsis sp. PS_44_ISF1]|nr:hypothetical protein [Amycolatopsis sp. PS_44_ISF1]
MVRPGFRERVEALLRDRWHEPVIVVLLDGDGLGCQVPGRRVDGTVKGKRLVRRFFWNILRGLGVAFAYGFYLANGAGSGGGKLGSPLSRRITVTGPEGALALGLFDGIRAADGPWLAFSPTRIALVDTGSTQREPAQAAPPELRWQSSDPRSPEVDLRRRKLTWPDGSVFAFPLRDRDEEKHLRAHLEPPNLVHWPEHPGNPGPQ